MPRRTTVIPAAHDFTPVYWNVAVYLPGTRSDAFHEEDDLWVRSEGLAPEDVDSPGVGDRLVWGLTPDLKHEMRLAVAMGRWGELDLALNTETLEELVITEAIAEPRTTRDGEVYGVLHLFVASATSGTRGGAR